MMKSKQARCFSLISGWDNCQRSSPLPISDTLLEGFEPMQNLSSDFVELSCAIVITITPQHHYIRTQRAILAHYDHYCTVVKTSRSHFKKKVAQNHIISCK